MKMMTINPNDVTVAWHPEKQTAAGGIFETLPSSIAPLSHERLSFSDTTCQNTIFFHERVRVLLLCLPWLLCACNMMPSVDCRHCCMIRQCGAYGLMLSARAHHDGSLRKKGYLIIPLNKILKYIQHRSW